MAGESTFGKKPERLRELFSLGADGLTADARGAARRTATLNMLVEKPGSEVGHYRLLRTLGEGGMGVVFLAKQSEPIKRQVALKVIKPGMDSARVIARFDAERQALALLDHPNIAHVFDAGTTEAGRPYFAMEYVKGLSITEYCDHHKLSIEERLRLFQQVCAGVQHAHQKGIIHRDIKPSNILISAENDQAVPKIIDFGVAKAVSQPLTERTVYTEDSQLLGTREYMSPEQADMVTEDIDTRSDVYSLGVLLYVLLSGILPYDSETFRQGGVEHVRKMIRETDPKTPSTRLTKLGDEAKKAAESRRTEVAALAKCLHRELEWIPLKAMRKERSERYRSASELADDIENYLKGEPLIAGPLTTLYRLKKFVRRNRAWVAGTAAVLMMLIAGIIFSTLFAIRADRALTTSKTVTDFLTEDVLGSVKKIKGRDATVAETLDVATKSLEGRFKDQPRIEAAIRYRLGMTYFTLGDCRASIPHLARSYQLRREQFGEYRNPTTFTKNYLALAYLYAGQYDQAEQLLTELIGGQIREDTYPPHMCNLACVYIGQGRYKEAKQLLVNALSSDTTAWWESWSPEIEPYLDHLAEIYLYERQYEQAEQLYKQVVEAKGWEGTSDPWAAIRSMYGLGRLYIYQERYDEAEEQFKKGIEAGRHWLPGKNHPQTLRNINGLAVLRTRQKRYKEAERLFHDALEARKHKCGEDHPETLESVHDLAVLYIRQARYEEAEPLLLEAYNGREAKLGPEHPHTIDSLREMVRLHESWPKPDEAEKWRAAHVKREE